MGRTPEGRAAQNAASRAYHDKLRAAGMTKMQVWASPQMRDDLQTLRAVHGSNDAAIAAALTLAVKAID